MKNAIVFFYIFFLLAFTAFAEEGVTTAKALDWLATDQRAVQYRKYEKEIAEIFERTRNNNVALNLLFEKLKEGASKGVAWEKLSEALLHQYESVMKAEEIVTHAEETYGKGRLQFRDVLVEHISLFLDGGLDPLSVVRPLLDVSLTLHGNPDRFIAACEMLIEIGSFGVEDQKTLYSLGDALIKSRLAIASYTSISSLFIKARARRMNNDDITNLFTGIVKQGGGIVQIEQELERRSRNR